MVPCAFFCSSVGRCVYREDLTLAAEADVFEPHGPAVVQSLQAEAAVDVHIYVRHVMMTIQYPQYVNEIRAGGLPTLLVACCRIKNKNPCVSSIYPGRNKNLANKNTCSVCAANKPRASGKIRGS